MTQQQTAYVEDARSVRAASATLYLAIPLFVAMAFGWNRTLVGPETSLTMSWMFWCGFTLLVWTGAALGSELVYHLLARWRPPLWVITGLGPIVAGVVLVGVYAPVVEFGRTLGGGLISPSRLSPALTPDFAFQFLRDILPGAILWVGVNYLFDRLIGMPRYRYAAPSRPVALPLAESAPSPPILLRLPETLRGDLLFLQAEDHYVRVATTAGQTLVHSRFADAITAASPVEGVQIHRSFWVASQAVAELTKANGAYAVRLVDGSLLPVSRTHLTAIRRSHATTPAR